jgi:hypothetical protein
MSARNGTPVHGVALPAHGESYGPTVTEASTPTPKILGLIEWGAVIRWAAKAIGAALLASVVFFAGWYATVNRGLDARPTKAELREVVRPIERRIDTLEKEQRTIRESQIKQATDAEHTTKALKDIAREMRRLKRK